MMNHSDTNTALRNSRYVKFILPIVGIGIVLTIVSLALIAVTLVTVNKRFDDIQNNNGGVQQTTSTPSTALPATTTTTTTTTTIQQSTQQPLSSQLAESINIAEVMAHLNELQRIATSANGTRAINTPGFNGTLDYITNYLAANTNYNVTKSFFPVREFVLTRDPILFSSIDSVVTNHTYSTDLSIAEFYRVQFTTSVNFPNYVSLTAIPDVGCTEADWEAANASGQVALVKRGNCTFVEKADLAIKYNVSALLLYNDGTAPDRFQPLNVNLGESNTLPALFLSFTLGQKLADAAENASVRIEIAVANDLPLPVGNICADTPTGDVTQTIVVGSHSDSVPAGPGINDNGSGSAANLALAVALARLFRTPSYAKYKYRVRFCWWGAEEVGLLGSEDHVAKAKNATIVGERLQDYLINLNFDMLGSPNYIFGIYDGKTANNATPPTAIPGSNKISSLFRDWFIQQNLPWDFTDFSGRSDYGPFLARGIVAGGLFTGADETKTQEQRDRYDRILGQGLGGIAGAIQDPCYHEACDSIQNINQFAFEKMVQAAAYAIEYLGRQDDLKAWLYPAKELGRSDTRPRGDRVYDSVNEYFGLPYL